MNLRNRGKTANRDKRDIKKSFKKTFCQTLPSFKQIF